MSQYSAARGQLGEIFPHTEPRRPEAGLNQDREIQNRTRNELKIRVLSTHGDPHLCGLTEIELFDSAAKKIVVLPPNVTVRNIGRSGAAGGSSGIHMSTKALVNGEKFTNEHRNMWIGSLPLPQTPPIFLEILVYFALNIDLAAVKIWNYNKSVRDGTKGVRDVELYLNDELKYEGTVKMGRGQINDDYSQLIAIQENVKISRESLYGIEEAEDRKNEETID